MPNKGQIIYVMGVSGCGKSTIGKGLAKALDLPFADADDFHPPANINKMKAGKALNDEDRAGWLQAISDYAQAQLKDQGAVITCSALKEKYRQVLVHKLGEAVKWVYLKGSFDLIQKRMGKRKNHFMPAALLKSQFETLEEPTYGIHMDIANKPTDIIDEILLELK